MVLTHGGQVDYVWGPGIHMVLKGSYWKKGREFIRDRPIKDSGLGHPTIPACCTARPGSLPHLHGLPEAPSQRLVLSTSLSAQKPSTASHCLRDQGGHLSP